MVLSFGRAQELARGRCVSRGVGRRCAGTVAAATRIEALLCNTLELERMVEDAVSTLRVQYEASGVLFLYTRFRACRTRTAELHAALVERGVLPRNVPAFRAQVWGLLGLTAAGRPLELEEGPGVLIVVFPRAFAELEAGFDSDAAQGASPHVIATSVILSGCEEAFVQEVEALDTDGKLVPSVFGGVARGRTEALHVGGASSGADAVSIRWLRAGTAPAGAGLRLAHVQTMGNRTSGRGGAIAQQRAKELVAMQQKAVAAVPPAGGHPPRAIVVFACNGRGTRLYEDPSMETSLIHEAYCPVKEAENSEGRSHPAIFGMFCGGELGPRAGHEGSGSSDTEEPLSTQEIWAGHAAKDGVSHLEVASAGQTADSAAGQRQGGIRSSLQGFTTIVGVVA